MVPLCRVDELRTLGALGVDPDASGADTVLVLHRAERVTAFVNCCPHQQARLGWRKNRFLSADGRYIVCFAHGARFDPETGVCIAGACLGQSLKPVACVVERGWVWASRAEVDRAVSTGD